MKDLIQGLAVDDSEISSKLTPLPYVILDEVIDLRPPVYTVVTVLLDDIIPSFLKPKPEFWVGPVPKVPIDSTEGHFSTVTLPATIFHQLKKIAKTQNVSVNGLLTSVSMVAEAELIRQLYPADIKSDGTVQLKFYCPTGKAVRQIGKVSMDQVGNFVMTAEEVYTLPATATTTNYNYMWKLAAELTEIGKKDISSNLDFLGLLNFLPRDCLTPWFIRDGSKYVMSRNSSIEISNLGALSALENLIKKDVKVSSLFDSKSFDKMHAYMPLGRAYRGPVLAAGAATTHDNLSLTISCQLGQCGCKTNFIPGSFCKIVKDANTSETTVGEGRVICRCPKEGLLHKYSILVHQILLAISNL